MAVQKGQVRPFQLYEGQWHTGLTMETHLANMYKKMPYYASDMVEKMFESTFGDDIISHVNQYPVFKAKDRVYRWLGVGMTEKNIPLIQAWEDKSGSIPVGTSTPYIGANSTDFFLDFGEKLFGSKQHIVGMKPDLYRLWILEEPTMIEAGRWRYRCQLTGSDGVYIPKEELKAGTRWSGDGGLVANDFSRDGYQPTFTSPFEFENRMSQFRTMIKVPGSVYREGKYGDNVYMFKFLDSDGNQHKIWFDAYWYTFLKMNRVDRAKKFLYDKSNKLADGTTANVDSQTGMPADEGSGLYELMSAGNIHPYYPGGLSVDYITKVILDASVTKVPEDKRAITIMAGEYGLVDLHKMLRRDLISTYTTPAYMGDTTGRAYQWSGNKVHVNLGQITGYADVNGVKVTFMHAPHKDNPIRNKLLYQNGGRASSYEYDILDFGTTIGRPNIKRVEFEGENDIYALQLGIRSAFGSRGSEKMPAIVSTETDMDVIHYMSWIGSIIWNPTKVIRLIPAVLYR